jgi:cysteinyl-tRNA synthetase
MDKAPPGFEKQFLNEVTGPLRELNNLFKKLTNRFNETEAAANKYHEGEKEYIKLNKDHHDLLVATDSLMKYATAFDNLSKGKQTGFQKLSKKKLNEIIKKQRPTDKKKAVTTEEYEAKRDFYKKHVEDAKKDLEESLEKIAKKRKELEEKNAVWDAKWDKWDKLNKQHEAMEVSIHQAFNRIWDKFENSSRSRASSGRSRGSSGRSRGSSDYAYEY